MKKQYYLLLFFITQLVQAQVFPVQVNPQLIPPYSLALSQYTNASREQLVLNLLLTDISELSRNVSLKFTLTNTAGFRVESAPVVTGAFPITLSGGVPLRLTNADLQAYFEFQNLTGIAPAVYGTTLPDGLYQFCFQVFDTQTLQPLSRQSCASAFLVLNDPPFLNVPNKGEIIAERNPQNIIFQWTPRHLNATNVAYEFTLVELWDELQDPQAVFLASRPLYQTTTRATTLLYGPAQPGLLPNKNYAWRVRAIVSDGISEASIFKNNGYSEIYYFQHNGECLPPQFALTQPKTKNAQNIQWQGGDYVEYKVQYRKASSNSSNREESDAASLSGEQPQAEGAEIWFEVSAFNEQASIFNLEESTTYQYRVGGQCRANGGFSYGNISEFTTATSNAEAGGYECGILPDIQITNQEPLLRLGVNGVFTAGDFPVTVKYIDPSSSPQSGSYTGMGYIQVPYLADTRIAVVFNNIKINTDYQLTAGTVETDYDPTWQSVDDISNELEAVAEIGTTVADLAKIGIDASAEAIGNFIDTIKEKLEKAKNDLPNETVKEIETALDSLEEAKEAFDQAETAAEQQEATQQFENAQQTIQKSVPETEPSSNNDEPYILFRNKKYTSNDVISIAYDNAVEKENLEFYGASEDAKIVWDIYANETDVSVASIAGEGKKVSYKLMRSSQDFYLGLQYWNNPDDYPGDSERKELRIKVSIKESQKFILKDLYAKDARKDSRLAKKGEILYLLKSTGITSPNDRKRSVNYNVVSSAKLVNGQYNDKDIVWDYSNINGTKQYDYGKININRSLWERDEVHTTSVEAGNPNKEKMSVDVEWVDNYKYEADVVPVGIKNALTTLSKYVNKAGTVLHKIDESGELSFNISFIGEEYVEEDKTTRFYNIIREGGVSGSIDFEFSGLEYGFDIIVAEAKLFLRPAISVTAEGKFVYNKRNDEEEFVLKEKTLAFKPQVKLSTGAKIEIDLYVAEAKLKGFAGLSTWGEIKYITSKTENDRIEGNLGIGKPFIGVSGEILIADQNILPAGEVKKVWEDIKFEEGFSHTIK